VRSSVRNLLEQGLAHVGDDQLLGVVGIFDRIEDAIGRYQIHHVSDDRSFVAAAVSRRLVLPPVLLVVVGEDVGDEVPQAADTSAIATTATRQPVRANHPRVAVMTRSPTLDPVSIACPLLLRIGLQHSTYCPFRPWAALQGWRGADAFPCWAFASVPPNWSFSGEAAGAHTGPRSIPAGRVTTAPGRLYSKPGAPL